MNNTQKMAEALRPLRDSLVAHRTGRTFRLLLDAIRLASAGERVAVVVYSSEYGRDLLHRAAEMAQDFGGVTHTPGGTPCLAFPTGGGWLAFISKHKVRRQPIRGTTQTLYDHYQED